MWVNDRLLKNGQEAKEMTDEFHKVTITKGLTKAMNREVNTGWMSIYYLHYIYSTNVTTYSGRLYSKFFK